MQLIVQNPTLLAHIVKSRRKGFTLIELIVVIAIIGTLLAVGVGTIKNVAGSKGVNTGVSISEGIFDHARSVAKVNGAARVIIYADEGGDNEDKREKYLRKMVVSEGTLQPKADPADPDVYLWSPLGGGVNLPTDTFFNANLSELSASNKIKAIFPGSSKEKDCYFYEFNSEGALVSPVPDITGGKPAKFIIQSGKLIPGKTVPKEMPKRKRDVGGFAIWKTGKTSIYRSPDQIDTGDLDF